MWFFREVTRLVVRVAIAVVIALVLAAFVALISAHSFSYGARILCIVFGASLLAMAGVGRGSNLERYMDQGVTKTAWGTIPGFDILKRHPEDPTINPNAVFICAGAVMLAIGLVAF